MDPGADRQINLKAVRAARAAKAEAARKAASDKAAADRKLRAEALNNVEPAELPTVDVAINAEKVSEAPQPIVALAKKSSAQGRAKKIMTASQQATALKVKSKRGSEQQLEPPPTKKNKRNVDDSSGATEPAADQDEDEVVVAEDIDDDVVQLSPSSLSTRPIPAESSGPSAQPMYFTEEFLNNSALPGWRQKMYDAITDVSPIPYFVRPWKHGDHMVVGEALARRLATTNPAFPRNLSPEAQVDTAIADFGLAAHSIATALFAARDGMDRAMKLGKTAVERQNAEFNSTLESLRRQLDTAKTLDEERIKLMKLAEQRASNAETALAESKGALAESKKAYAELEKSFNEFKAAAGDAAIKSAQDIDAAKNVAEVAELRATEAEKNALKCYEQGVYHMARCWYRDMQANFTPDLEEFAGYSLLNSTTEELLAYHSVIPFTPAEIERINEKRRGKGLGELEFGEVAEVNMRAIQEDMEAIMVQQAAAESAAAAGKAGAEASVGVGEDLQIEAAGGVEDRAQVIDPSGSSEAKEGEGSQTAKAADGAAP